MHSCIIKNFIFGCLVKTGSEKLAVANSMGNKALRVKKDDPGRLAGVMIVNGVLSFCSLVYQVNILL